MASDKSDRMPASGPFSWKDLYSSGALYGLILYAAYDGSLASPKTDSQDGDGNHNEK